MGVTTHALVLTLAWLVVGRNHSCSPRNFAVNRGEWRPTTVFVRYTEGVKRFPAFNLTFDEVPCHTGCCNATFTVRRHSADLKVLYFLLLKPTELAEVVGWRPGSSGWVLDAGANIGAFSALLCLLHPSLPILAVEMDAANFGLLHLNTAHCQHIVRVHGALWGNSTRLSIQRGHGWGPPEWQYEAVADPEGRHLGVSVPDLLAAHNITTLQLAKVDIEGAEREVFAAPSAAVWLNRTREVWIEIHEGRRPGAEAAVHNALTAAGLALRTHTMDKEHWYHPL